MSIGLMARTQLTRQVGDELSASSFTTTFAKERHEAPGSHVHTHGRAQGPSNALIRIRPGFQGASPVEEVICLTHRLRKLSVVYRGEKADSIDLARWRGHI